MKILRRHISITLLMSIGMVLFALCGLHVFIGFIEELSEVGNGHYGLFPAFLYVLLTLPQGIYHIFPMACLLGSLVGLGSLASHCELTVMRTSGMSPGQITKEVCRMAFLMMVFSVVLGGYIAPKLSHYAAQQKDIAESGGQAVQTTRGVWMRQGLDFIHIQQVLPGKRLEGVTVYQFDNKHRLLSTLHAKTAVYDHRHWLFRDVKESKINEEGVSAKQVPEIHWNIHLKPSLLRMMNVDPENMSLKDLYRNMHQMSEKGLSGSKYRLSFWQRVIQPFSTLVMILLAVPWIFGPLRSVTVGIRILTGIVLGFSFYVANQFFGPVSLVYQLPPFLGAVLPPLVFGGAGLLLYRRI